MGRNVIWMHFGFHKNFRGAEGWTGRQFLQRLQRHNSLNGHHGQFRSLQAMLHVPTESILPLKRESCAMLLLSVFMLSGLLSQVTGSGLYKVWIYYSGVNATARPTTRTH